MKLRQWFRSICYFFIFFIFSEYNFWEWFSPWLHHTTRFSLLPNCKIRTKLFRNSFFPYTVNEWNNFDNIRKWSEWYLTLRKTLLNLIRPKCNETYGIHHPTGLKLPTRLLRLSLSHLNDYEFKSVMLIIITSVSVENNVHFFLHCHHFSLHRHTLMNSIKSIDNITKETDSDLANFVLFGSSK